MQMVQLPKMMLSCVKLWLIALLAGWYGLEDNTEHYRLALICDDDTSQTQATYSSVGSESGSA